MGCILDLKSVSIHNIFLNAVAYNDPPIAITIILIAKIICQTVKQFIKMNHTQSQIPHCKVLLQQIIQCSHEQDKETYVCVRVCVSQMPVC
jgi:hypothetical protein